MGAVTAVYSRSNAFAGRLEGGSRLGAHACSEAVAPARHGLHIAGTGRRVFERDPDLADRKVEALLEFKEGVLSPEMTVDLFPGNHLAGAAGQ